MNMLFKTSSSLLAAVALTLTANAAWASVAANTQIVNQATLSYNDGSGTKSSSSTVTVAVSLVPTGVTIIPGPPQTTSYNGPATKVTNSFIVTANANGPDTYTLSSAITGTTNTGAPNAATATPTAASVALGATITTTGSSNLVLVVPSDGVNNNSVNGIIAGSTVVVSGDVRTVQSVADNATGTSTIVLTSALTSAPGAGVLVAEQKTVTVEVTAGTIVTSGTDVTVSKNLTVTSTTSGGATATSGAITDTFTSGVATLTKYVRNTISPSGTGVPFVYNSINYYRTGVTAKPGETLEYILVAANTGVGAVTGSGVTDVLPVSYATLKANAYGAGKEVTYVSDTNATSTYSAAADTDQATYNAGSGTLTVYVGTGATSAAGGSIPGGNKSVLVLYQLTINP